MKYLYVIIVSVCLTIILLSPWLTESERKTEPLVQVKVVRVHRASGAFENECSNATYERMDTHERFLSVNILGESNEVFNVRLSELHANRWW